MADAAEAAGRIADGLEPERYELLEADRLVGSGLRLLTANLRDSNLNQGGDGAGGVPVLRPVAAHVDRHEARGLDALGNQASADGVQMRSRSARLRETVARALAFLWLLITH